MVVAAPPPADDERRLESLSRAIRELDRELRASLGPADVAYLERLHRWNGRLKILGRACAAFLPWWIGLPVGSALLAVVKLVSVGPLGHDIYHGAWEHVPGAERFAMDGWQWDAPIDRDVWRAMHNHAHHAHTGTAHRDIDDHFLFARVNPYVETDPVITPVQWAVVLGCLGAFTHVAHMQYQGVFDALAQRLGRRPVRKEPVATRAALGDWWASVRAYTKEHYLVGPLWFGPFAPWVILAELAAGRVRDLALFYFAYATHAGPESPWMPEEHHSGSRGAWLRDRIAVSYDSRLPRLASLVLDGVDLHIEHHVLPRVPSHRYAEAAPRLRAICEAHGVPYRVQPIPVRLWHTFRELWRLRRRDIRSR
ncbi:MAG: fatty acid desaturase [Myxococcales bacterium]|nr:fatty acid desaturase [Myxococcales bacterium]